MEEKKTQKSQAKKPKTDQSEEILALNEKVTELQAQADDYKDKWMRNVAEFDNYKKRNAKIWSDAFNDGASSVILKILPVGDSLDWALQMDLDEKTKEGVKGIKKKFEETLSQLEVTEINPIGEVFDPNVAEAVMQVEGGDGEESDTVKQVFQKGYKMKDKIIRYATVSVIK